MQRNHLIESAKKPQTETPPAIILLHGYGSNEYDLFGLKDFFPPHYLVISLQAFHPMESGGYCWFDIRWGEHGFSVNHQAVQTAMESVYHELQMLSNTSKFDLKNSILLGFSQGAILSYALTVNFPEVFRTIIGCSGAWLPHTTATINAPKPEERVKYNRHRAFIGHGTQDPVLSCSESDKVSERFKLLGIEHRYTKYPIGHSISPQEIRDISSWISEQNQK